MPRVSLIIPVYNAEKYIERCIQSVFSQSFSDFEIIAIDDGSTDNSLQVLRALSLKDPRLKIIAVENAGVSSARNTGLAASTGEFIAFIDADDSVCEDYLEKMVTAISSKDADACQCGCYVHAGAKKTVDYLPAFQTVQKDDIIKNIVFPLLGKNDDAEHQFPGFSWLWMLRKSLIGTTCFDMELQLLEDAMFLAEVLAKANTITSVSVPLYNYYVNNTGATMRLRPDLWNQTLIFTRKAIRFLEDQCLINEDSEKRVICRAGNRCIAACRMNAALYPRNLRKLIAMEREIREDPLFVKYGFLYHTTSKPVGIIGALLQKKRYCRAALFCTGIRMLKR